MKGPRGEKKDSPMKGPKGEKTFYQGRARGVKNKSPVKGSEGRANTTSFSTCVHPSRSMFNLRPLWAHWFPRNPRSFTEADGAEVPTEPMEPYGALLSLTEPYEAFRSLTEP